MARDLAKVTLDLDDFGDQDRSILDLSLADGVEDEKCVVSQYRTTPQQKAALQNLVRLAPSREEIPVEWVIDIADESNGWFYATAYHFDDVNQMLHVMVPDRENPTFDGKVQLDHRTVHLIECVDSDSIALFNKIVRDSVQKIKWDVEWFEEGENASSEGNNTADGNWIASSARYYIRMANQLLVEDKDSGSDTRGFVIITADINVRLIKCHKGRGVEDFQRLIAEGIVVNGSGLDPSTFTNTGATVGGINNNNNTISKNSADNEGDNNNLDKSTMSSSGSTSTRKLAEMARLLKDNITDLISDRDRKKKEEIRLASRFRSFALDGDLDEGLNILGYFEKLQDSNNKENTGDGSATTDGEESEEKKISIAANDAKYLSEKLEKYLLKLLKAGKELNSPNNNAPSEDVEYLKKAVKKLKRELDDKDRELRHLKENR